MASIKGGVIAAKTNQVEKPASKSMKALVNAMMPQIVKALPSVLTGERFTRMVLTALSSTPKLQECTPDSFMGAMMQAAQLGVEPNTPLGQAYLIPYRNKGHMETQFQLGYKGLIDLAYRSGDVTDIAAHEVYENDNFNYELGLTPQLRHKPALTNRGNVIAYYAVFHTKSGGYGFEVMSREDVEKHAKQYSRAYAGGFSPWSSNFDSMAKKTVLKRCLKYAPLKTDFVRAVGADETIKSTISADMSEIADETEINVTPPAETVAQTAEPAAPRVDTETGDILYDGKSDPSEQLFDGEK